MWSTWFSMEKAWTDCGVDFFIKQKNSSILEAKKILIRRAITRAGGKSPLMKFPVDHMQFVSSHWTTNCNGRYQGVSVLSAVNWLVKQVQILYPHSRVGNRGYKLDITCMFVRVLSVKIIGGTLTGQQLRNPLWPKRAKRQYFHSKWTLKAECKNRGNVLIYSDRAGLISQLSKSRSCGIKTDTVPVSDLGGGVCVSVCDEENNHSHPRSVSISPALTMKRVKSSQWWWNGHQRWYH